MRRIEIYRRAFGEMSLFVMTRPSTPYDEKQAIDRIKLKPSSVKSVTVEGDRAIVELNRGGVRLVSLA
jgi:hypothetical protein